LGTSAHRLLHLGWYFRRPRTLGAHAIVLTPERRIVLVKLRYAPHWRVPGGGRKINEDPRDAVLRELREEIGLLSHGGVRFLGENAELVNHRRDLSTVHVVEDALYRPRWSLEVEQVREFALDRLPADIHPTTSRWIGRLLSER
jgi:ADP-ribose pyrophosphatase YjhB (NUDIX family)